MQFLLIFIDFKLVNAYGAHGEAKIDARHSGDSLIIIM